MGVPKDSTLRTVMPLLADRDAFVSRAFGVMHRQTRDHGHVAMRLGITGTGQFPNYRIEDAATGRAIVAIDGANHEPWPDGERFDATGTWSDSTMSKSDVESLLGEIRNFTRKG
ncbi:hypothetical protein [Sphingomonas sp. RB1R13]|uniref:hypothetical protein n=1 Tax=Sphingomonas sp. RB1R13 TaxID=3096159 RepID=UPI002FC8C577